MKRGPRLLIQMLAGNLLTTLPLLAGISYALIALQENSVLQHRLLVDGLRSTRTGSAVVDQLKQLERAVRQHRVLGDEEFGGVVDAAHRQTLTLLLQAEDELPLAAQPGKKPIAELKEQLKKIPWLLQRSTSDAQIARYFSDNAQLGAQLREQIQSWLDAELGRAESGRDDTRRRLVLLGALALPLTVLLAIMATTMVARPLQRLTRSIHDLGLGNWERAVHISGPSDVVELGVRLEWLRGQLIDTEQQKSAFVRDITHELKTPLAAVMEAAALLADGIPGPLNVRQQAVLALLGSNAAALQELIEQLLHFEGAGLGVDADVSTYALRDLIETAVSHVADLAAAKRLCLDVSGDELYCRIDRRRLQLILGNLLSNAIRHSPDGGSISLHWRAQPEGLLISVTDDGEGVAEESMGEIFKPFYTGVARTQGALRGTGLGLAIARECVTRLDGEISVMNISGRGACFEVRLPIPDIGTNMA